MLSGIARFVIFRLFGARVLLVLSVLAWLRNRIWPRRNGTTTSRTPPGRASSGGDRR